jgi:phage FluMu protein Com
MECITRCTKCGKLLEPVVAISGRTELQCISCDDPAVKWAESPLTVPESPDLAEPAAHH